MKRVNLGDITIKEQVKICRKCISCSECPLWMAGYLCNHPADEKNIKTLKKEVEY